MEKFKAWTAALAARLSVLREEEGQGLVEYAIIITFVALICIVALTALGNSIAALLTNLAGDL